MKRSRRVFLGLAGSAAALLALPSFAYAESLVILLEGLGGRTTSQGMVSLQKELSVIPDTRVPLPLAQHSWRDAIKLIQQQKPETKIVVIGYSLGANNDCVVGNAQTLIPGISSSPYRNPEAWECASASGFFRETIGVRLQQAS